MPGSAQNQDPESGAAFCADLVRRIKTWARELGFAQAGIADTELDAHEAHLLNWLDRGRHGEMDYMARHGVRRSRPRDLVPGTLRVISVRMDYLPPDGVDPWTVLEDPLLGYVSRYALGRDYHKVLRARLQALAERIAAVSGPFGYRAFVDSAPVLEKALAERAGLGWIGKHTNLINARSGSWFFLGELYTDLPLPPDAPGANHCGSCRACIDVCPTQAIVAPYELDARRCISYLTIESRGPIPVELRPLIGNRIFGCDDCQLVCPWNRFAAPSNEPDFTPRHGLDAPGLRLLFAWSEAEFLQYTSGSAIRRAGYDGWRRNIAVALGNALRGAREPDRTAIIESLTARGDDPSALVREHVRWALEQQAMPAPGRPPGGGFGHEARQTAGPDRGLGS